MITLTANSSPQDVNGVVEIISHLSDEAKFTDRLNILKGMAEAADKKMTAANAQAEKYATAEQMLADATALMQSHQEKDAILRRQGNDLTEREHALEVHEGEVNQQHLATAQSLTDRETAVSARESAVTDAEQAVAAAKAKVDAARIDIEQREAKAQELARAIMR